MSQNRAFALLLCGLLGIGVALAGGLVLSAVVAGRAFKEVKLAGQTITVKGYAEQAIRSDWASWRGHVSTRAEDLGTGYERLEADVQKVLAWLAEFGVPDDQVRVSAADADALYARTEKGQRTNRVEAYVLSQSVSVESADVDLVERLARQSTRLMGQGIVFHSERPEFLYTKLEDLKIEMLAAATADARRRAEALAEGSDSGVGALRSAHQGVFQITAAHSTEVSGYGVYSTGTIEKVIKAIVSIDYGIR